MVRRSNSHRLLSFPSFYITAGVRMNAIIKHYNSLESL